MKNLIVVACLSFASTGLTAQVFTNPGFSSSVVVSGFEAPVAMAVASDGRVFVTEQAGTVRVVRDGAILPTPVLSLVVDSQTERGLLGIALAPGFPATPYQYVLYTVPGNPPFNRISRFTISGDVAVPGSELTIFELGDPSHRKRALIG